MNDHKMVHYVESRIKELNEHLLSLTKEVNSLSTFLQSLKNEVAAPNDDQSTTLLTATASTNNVKTVTPQQPFFRGRSSDVHPMDFIRELEEFVVFYGATAEQQINLAISCLQDEARTFARAFRYKFNTFAEFKTSFLDQFWGTSRQRKVRKKLESGIYESKKGKSHMADYFLRWFAIIRTLRVVPSTTTFLDEISRHFPVITQDSLRKYGDGSVETALLILEEEDELANQLIPKSTKQRRNQPDCWLKTVKLPWRQSTRTATANS
jgi:sulfite reductase alpha subunit-like flavoprotein